MWLAGALRRGRRVDENASVFHGHVVSRNGVLLKTRLAQTGAAVELPVVPRADDVLAVEPALTERPADVVAHSADRAELPVLVRQRQPDAANRDRLSMMSSMPGDGSLNRKRDLRHGCGSAHERRAAPMPAATPGGPDSGSAHRSRTTTPTAGTTPGTPGRAATTDHRYS